MLPALAKMFALVRDLSARREVTEIPASRWLVHRHSLGALAALAGVSQLRDELAASTVRWIALTGEMPPLVRRFNDVGIGVAPIKGLAYAAGLYEHPAARPMTDVDLLVQPGCDAAARRVLDRAGFRLRFDIPMHHSSTWERGAITLDLHRSILPTGRGRLALDEIWARTRPGWPEGARRLESTDELVFHLLHMVRDRLCGPLIQVVDAARLLEHASVRDALDRAESWRVDAAVAAAATYCVAILDETRMPRLAPSEREVLFSWQPTRARKLVFDIRTAGSVQQLVARLVGAAMQRLAS